MGPNLKQGSQSIRLLIFFQFILPTSPSHRFLILLNINATHIEITVTHIWPVHLLNHGLVCAADRLSLHPYQESLPLCHIDRVAACGLPGLYIQNEPASVPGPLPSELPTGLSPILSSSLLQNFKSWKKPLRVLHSARTDKRHRAAAALQLILARNFFDPKKHPQLVLVKSFFSLLLLIPSHDPPCCFSCVSFSSNAGVTGS